MIKCVSNVRHLFAADHSRSHFSDAFFLGALRVNASVSFFAQWLSGRVLDARPRGSGFKPHQRHCVVSLSKIHLSLLSTGVTQEDPSRHN